MKKKTKTADQWFGEHFRTHREQDQLSQDDIATKARQEGFPTWVRETVASIEAGRRPLSMWEFLWLRKLFSNLQFVDFFRVDFSHGEAIAITPALVVESSSLPSLFRDRPNIIRRPSAELVKARIEENQDAEVKAGRKLGIDPDTVHEISQKLFGGRSLTQERERLVDEQLEGKEVSMRERQAARGHVTRTLIERIRVETESIIEPKTTRKTKKQ